MEGGAGHGRKPERQGHHWLSGASGCAPRLGGLGPLRVSLLEVSEHSCSSPGARHLAGFCSSHRAVSGAGRRHCGRGQRWKGHGGDENREQEEGTVSFYKASDGTKPTLATQV